MSIELKPCPFCGGEAVTEFDSDWGMVVRCARDCGAMTVERRYPLVTDPVEAWNKRAERTCVVEEVVKRERPLAAPTWDYQFSCGHFAYEWPWKEAPAYCPDCGAKVVEE